MKIESSSKLAAMVAALGVVMSTTAFATTPAATCHDIALRPGGLLIGQVVDPQGIAVTGALVSIQYDGNEVVRTETDENGVFAAKGLRDGQYQLNTLESCNACHLWAADMAPPAASPAALVVSGSETVRGQKKKSGGHMKATKRWIQAHPYITSAAVATAVAVPFVAAKEDWDH